MTEKTNEIILTRKENEIFKIILQYADSLDPPTVPRVAGGWVRDKIMGLESHDIDIALDNISGIVFANGMYEKYGDALTNEFNNSEVSNCKDLGGESLPNKTMTHAHKIEANPDKSKHLETAVVTIFGLSIDLVHLRSEKYAEKSRIPVIKPGQPEDDAYRRDITINALFYNLKTMEIEDFTGLGLDDIKNRIIRTPLEPRTTFLDDPLRLLRVFRFKAKFDFQIDQEIYESLKLTEIHEAFRTKVSNERIAMELFKMIEYRDGYIGIIKIIETEYSNHIFQPAIEISINSSKSKLFYLSCLQLIMNLDSTATDFKEIFNWDISLKTDITAKTRALRASIETKCLEEGYSEKNIIKIVYNRIHTDLLWLYMILHNFTGYETKDGKRTEHINVLILRDSLKCSKVQVSAIKIIEDSVKYLINNENVNIIELVLFCGKYTFDSLLIAAVIRENTRYIDIINKLIISDHYNCYNTKPIVSGHDLAGTAIPKTQLKSALHNCLVYQIERPDATKEMILEVLKYKQNY